MSTAKWQNISGSKKLFMLVAMLDLACGREEGNYM